MQVTKGMRDFYPEEYKLREWLFEKFRGAALRSGFQFYDCPILESEEYIFVKLVKKSPISYIPYKISQVEHWL